MTYHSCGPIPQNMARALMPRQPYSVAVTSTGGRLHEKGGAFFNGKEGRDDFRTSYF